MRKYIQMILRDAHMYWVLWAGKAMLMILIRSYAAIEPSADKGEKLLHR